MTSYLRNWLSSQLSPSEPISTVVKPPSAAQSLPGAFVTDEDDDTETVRADSPGASIVVEKVEDEDDEPPAFPSLHSAQRLGNGSAQPKTGSMSPPPPPIPRILTDSSSSFLPPPPVAGLTARRPGATLFLGSNSLGVPQTQSSSLAPPLTTTKAPTKKSRKVALQPGHGPLDWANLKKSGQDLRGVDSLMRVTPSLLKQHNKKDDAWSAFNGKVYNITHYLSYHPGGEKELMRVAGRDGTKLFSSTHAWVNADYMLDECLVGFLVPETY